MWIWIWWLFVSRNNLKNIWKALLNNLGYLTGFKGVKMFNFNFLIFKLFSHSHRPFLNSLSEQMFVFFELFFVPLFWTLTIAFLVVKNHFLVLDLTFWISELIFDSSDLDQLFFTLLIISKLIQFETDNSKQIIVKYFWHH